MHNVKMASMAMAVLVTGSSLGCGDSGPEGTAPVRLNFQSGSSSFQASVAEQPRFSVSGPSGIDAHGLVLTDGNNNTMEITLVKMTLEDIDLERTDQSIDCATTTSGSFEDCSDYFAGPLLVELDLTGNGTTSPLTVQAPFGTFDVVSFDISVPDGGDSDQETYLGSNPDMRDVSIRIVGTFNDADFNFALDLRGDQELMLSPALEVTESNTGFEITVAFDIAAWFVRADGILIDPSSVCAVASSCADRSRIEETIELSIIAGL